MKKIHKLENDRINKNGYFSNGLNWNLRRILKEDLNIKHIYYRRKKKKKNIYNPDHGILRWTF